MRKYRATEEIHQQALQCNTQLQGMGLNILTGIYAREQLTVSCINAAVPPGSLKFAFSRVNADLIPQKQKSFSQSNSKNRALVTLEFQQLCCTIRLKSAMRILRLPPELLAQRQGRVITVTISDSRVSLDREDFPLFGRLIALMR